MSCLPGIGRRKLADLGEKFLNEVVNYCRHHDLSMDVRGTATEPTARRRKRPNRSSSIQTAFHLFEDGRSVDEVVQATDRARSTVYGYLADFIEASAPKPIDRWVDATSYRAVCEAIDPADGDRLKPIFDRLDGRVAYETIRLVLAHQRALHAPIVRGIAQRSSDDFPPHECDGSD